LSWGQALDVSRIIQALGRTGQTAPGDVYRVGFPRTDLHVTLDGVTLKPGLALGSYAVFKQYGQVTMMMGDLVFLQTEIEPVMKALSDCLVEITALHNHQLRSNPQVMYMHYMGMGDAGQLAATLRKALGNSATPIVALAAAAPEAPPLVQGGSGAGDGADRHRVWRSPGMLHPEGAGGDRWRGHGDSAEHGHG
jgi:hypothetical protein